MRTIHILYLFLVSIAVFQTAEIRAQQFTKITTGDIVTTPGGSRSCNFLDVNNDNFQDILITNGKTGGENNMLYLNNGDGTFSLINDTIVKDNTPTDGATCADYDNDGYIDVFAVNWYGIDNLLYRNNHGSSFSSIDTSIVSSQLGHSETAAWGDYNNDGLLDLYVTNSSGLKNNFFYENLGSGHFLAVTGTDPVTDNFFSRCANWIDYDRDGDQDLFVANENIQQNNLYRNDGGLSFTKITGDTIVSGNPNSMSSSWGDFDNDGDFDLFVANYQQHNQMFENDGSGNFSAVSGPWSTEVGCSFSSSFTDYDNDGNLDIFVTNGYCASNLNNYLYKNNGDGTFSKDTIEPMSTDLGGSFGCAWGDYDNNGFMDLVVANWQGEIQPNYLYRNDGNGNNWLKLKLEGTVSNRSAIGTIVRCKAIIDGDTIWQMREVSSQTGYCSQNSLVVHFGLKDATSIDSLQVIWPSGITQDFGSLGTNQFYTLIENGSIGITGMTNPLEDKKSIKVFPNPSDGAFTIEIPVLKGENVKIEIFDITGVRVLSRQLDINSNNKLLIKQNLGSKIPEGIYTIVVTVDETVRYSTKAVIMK